MTENNEKTWVDEFREALDEFGRKNKQHGEKLKELHEESTKIRARMLRRLKEKYGGDME